jgi:hypothetical protein
MEKVNIYYEFFKLYLFFAKEIHSKRLTDIDNKYKKILLEIYNYLCRNIKYLPDASKIFSYYYIENKNKFLRASKEYKDINNKIIFLVNNYNRHAKTLIFYYKIHIYYLREYYMLFYKKKLDEENFYDLSINFFKNTVKYTKRPKLPIDIEKNRENIENFRIYFNLPKK